MSRLPKLPSGVDAGGADRGRPRRRRRGRATKIGDQTTAERARFVVRPTVRVDGRDVDPEGELAAEYSLECRLYWHEHRLAGYPQDRSVRDALLRAAGPI